MDSTLADPSSAPGADAPPGGGRRCYLTVLFCDLCDSTKLSASMEAEDYGALLKNVHQTSELVVASHGGAVIRVVGDGVLAVFGYPEPHETDGRRAVEAARHLHAHCRSLGAHDAHLPPPQLHTGIHSGQVLVREGDMVHGVLELLGAVPNIASRLSDAALPDEILVSEETLGPESHFFQTGPKREVRVSGRDLPVVAYSILGRSPAQTRFEARELRGLAPFVGRQAELASLQDLLEAARLGAARHVALSGPAGVGKTRLAQEFRALATQRGCRVLTGYCESYLSAQPLQPFIQILSALFDVPPELARTDAASERVTRYLDTAGLQPHAPEFLRLLSLQSAQDPAADRGAADGALSALQALIAHLLARQPLVLFIDDWQWADAATRQMLSSIRTLESPGLFVLLATRGFEAGGATMNDIHVIELPPFSEGEATQSIAALLPAIDPFVAAEIRHYSGGNPLYIEELCHSAAHEDASMRRVRAQGGAAWLNGLIESRLARLPAEQAALVATAAVIGNVIPVWLLEELTGCTDAHPQVKGLADADFVFPGETPGTLRFKHGITRDAIHASVGLYQRRAMHVRIAEAVRRRSGAAQEEAYEALAYHYGAAGATREAAHYSELAGDKAVAVSALDRAKAQYGAALAALDAGLANNNEVKARWLAIADKLGRVCVFDAARRDLPTFGRAVELARQLGDGAALARALYWLGYVSFSLGESREAIQHCELALQAAGQGVDDRLTVQIRATLGQARTAACDYDGALPLLDEAVAVKKRFRSGSRPAVGLAFSLVCRGWVLGDRGEFDAANGCFDDASALVLGLTHEIGASITGLRSAVLLWQGRWADARAAAEESTRIAEQTRSLFQFCMGRALAGYADWKLGAGLDALQQVRQATAWLEPREGGLFRSLNHGWLAEGLMSLGRESEARHSAARALVRGRKGDLIGVAMAYRALAEGAATLSKDRARAEHYLVLADRVARQRGSPHEAAVTQLCAAGILQGFGDPGGARASVDQAMAAFERMDMQWHLAQARRLAAAL